MKKSNLARRKQKRGRTVSEAKASAKPRERLPAWAEYCFGPGWRQQFLSAKDIDNPSWKKYKRAAGDAFRERKKATSTGADTPQRIRRRFKATGFAGFVAQPTHRPKDTKMTAFATRYRTKHPELSKMKPRAQWRVIRHAHMTELRRKTRAYTSHFTTVTAASLNVKLLRVWYDKKVDSTPRITRTVLEKLEKGIALSWRYWRTHGMGRLFADPWESIASMNRKARAVLCFGTYILDLDMSNCHPRIALMKGIKYGVTELKPLQDYVADSKAWRRRIALETGCSDDDSKMLGVIMLNLGSLSCWIQACECVPDVSESLREEIEAFRACVLRVRDATLERERSIFPPALRGANPRRRWSFSLCAVEDRALRAIWDAVAKLGAKVVMLVYDGLMLLPQGADTDELSRAATAAATRVCGCTMPARFKAMELPQVMQDHLDHKSAMREKRKTIATRDATIVERDATIASLRAEIARLRMSAES